MTDKNKNKEEALKKFISSETSSTEKKETPMKKEKSYSYDNLSYLSVDLNMLPAGEFYPENTIISIRAATVGEIQAYSTVDDRNYIDVTEKMNHILGSCIRVVRPDGKSGNYKDIKDNDRLFLIFMIRELTFQKNTNLAKDVSCGNCNNEFKIQFRATSSDEQPSTFVNYEMDEDLREFFDEENKCFVFNLNDFDIEGDTWKIAPPTIGIQEIFFNDIKEKVQNEKNPNIAFLKIIPYILWDRTSITEEGIKKWEKTFKEMGKEEFLFLNSVIDKLKFGIKELISICPSCGSEVHTDMSFPEGASSIFSVPDPFTKFKKK
jgi:hypothetical protein